MPRARKKYHGYFSYKDAHKRVVRVPGTLGIAWYVVSVDWNSQMVQLRSLPNGHVSETCWSTLRNWLASEWMEALPEQYDSWVEAAIALYPKDFIKGERIIEQVEKQLNAVATV